MEHTTNQKLVKEIEVIEKVKGILQERAETHGDADITFEKIAEFWSTYLGLNLNMKDVSIMMMLLKVARESNVTLQRKDNDNLLDLVGYSLFANSLQGE